MRSPGAAMSLKTASRFEYSGTDPLRDHEPRVERKPGDADAVGRVRGDLAGDERAVALVVAVRRAADERLRGDDAPSQVGVRAVDPGVDHGHAHRQELRLRRP